MVTKNTYGAPDAAPVVLHAKQDADSKVAYPLLANSDGSLLTPGLIPGAYDYIALTYVASGNGEGEVETATYKINGSTGSTIAIITLTYNSDGVVDSVTKT